MSAIHPEASKAVLFTEADFIPLPAKSFRHRGIQFSRSTLLRLREQGRIKLARFRFTGSTKPRLYILRESLDTFITDQLSAE